VQRVAGKVELFSKDKFTFADIYEKAFAFDQEKNVAEGHCVTANLITHKYLFNEIGMFDDSLMSGGDFKWNDLATKQGITMSYFDDVVVYHPLRSAIAELETKSLRVVKGYLRGGDMDLKFKVKAFIPPVNKIRYLFNRKGLNTYQKCVAFLVAYYLKLYVLFNLNKK
jgi:hypothetical protein